MYQRSRVDHRFLIARCDCSNGRTRSDTPRACQRAETRTAADNNAVSRAQEPTRPCNSRRVGKTVGARKQTAKRKNKPILARLERTAVATPRGSDGVGADVGERGNLGAPVTEGTGDARLEGHVLGILWEGKKTGVWNEGERKKRAKKTWDRDESARADLCASDKGIGTRDVLQTVTVAECDN